MSFPNPPYGEGLEEFIDQIDVQFYCMHLGSVAQNRRWLAEQLLQQGMPDAATEMFAAAVAAEAQLLVAEGFLVNHDPDVEKV